MIQEHKKKKWIKSLNRWYLIDEDDPEYEHGLDFLEHEQETRELGRGQYLGK